MGTCYQRPNSGSQNFQREREMGSHTFVWGRGGRFWTLQKQVSTIQAFSWWLTSLPYPVPKTCPFSLMRTDFGLPSALPLADEFDLHCLSLQCLTLPTTQSTRSPWPPALFTPSQTSDSLILHSFSNLSTYPTSDSSQQPWLSTIGCVTLSTLLIPQTFIYLICETGHESYPSQRVFIKVQWDKYLKCLLSRHLTKTELAISVKLIIIIESPCPSHLQIFYNLRKSVAFSTALPSTIRSAIWYTKSICVTPHSPWLDVSNSSEFRGY